jgi:hypothetical protein
MSVFAAAQLNETSMQQPAAQLRWIPNCLLLDKSRAAPKRE